MRWVARVRWASLLVLAVSLSLSACRDGAEASAVTAPPGEVTPAVLPPAPNGGHWIELGDDALLEFRHDEHWGKLEIWLYDLELAERSFDRPPVINLLFDEEAVALAASRGLDLLEEGPRSWSFEHDGLLGEPEGARFRLHVGGQVFTPGFAHTHHGGGHTHATASEDDAGTLHGPSVIHGPGPKGGILHHLGAHVAHIEVKHDENMGTVMLWLYDEALKPLGFDRRPVLNAVLDDESLAIEGMREDDEGNAIDGWYFEDTALLGIPDRTRFRLSVEGTIYTPDLVYVPHGEEPGHSHE